MFRERIFITSTPSCSSDIDYKEWAKEQDWYNPENEYVAIYDSEWVCYDIYQLS